MAESPAALVDAFVAAVGLAGPPPWIVGHRGVAGEAPENTLESFRRAVDQGADMVELDLQLTRDRRLVVFHDWQLDRLTGSSGRVEAMTRAELERSPVRFHPAGRETAAPIPGVEEVLAALPPELPLNLELKRRTADPGEIAQALGDALDGRRRVLVSSFDWPLLAEVRRRLPDLPLAPLGERGGAALLAAADGLDAVSLHCHRRLARRPLIRAAEAAGRPLLVYTVNEPDAARRLLDRGVAGLFTDFPGRLRRQLEGGP